jgi:hypothetical protein
MVASLVMDVPRNKVRIYQVVFIHDFMLCLMYTIAYCLNLCTNGPLKIYCSPGAESALLCQIII